MKELSENTRWFIANAYVVAGRPRMESALMDFAKQKYLYYLVYDSDLGSLVEQILKQQTQLRAENPRWQSVDVHITDFARRYNDNLIWLHIGAQHLTLQLVMGEI